MTGRHRYPWVHVAIVFAVFLVMAAGFFIFADRRVDRCKETYGPDAAYSLLQGRCTLPRPFP